MIKHYCGATKKNRSSGSKKLTSKLPNFGTLAVGSFIGVLLTSSVFYLFSTSGITLKVPVPTKVTANATQTTTLQPEPELEAKQDNIPPEPRFDFYTELTKGAQEVNQPIAPTPTLAKTEKAPKTIAATPAAPKPSAPVLDLKSKTKAINLYLVQAGSFKARSEADALRATLTLDGLEAKIETAKLPSGEVWHRVMLGPFKTENSAKALQQSLKTQGVNGILVVKYAN